MKKALSLFLCVCLLFSFSVFSAPPARAVVPEVILGASAAALFSLVSGLMSVAYSYQNFTVPSLNDFFGADPLSEIGRFWVSNISGGMVQLRGDLSALRNLASVAADKISSLSIPDNSSGTAYSYTGLSYDGYLLDTPLGTGYLVSSSFGSVDVVAASGAFYRTYGPYWVSWQYSSASSCTVSFYHGDELLSSSVIRNLPSSFSADVYLFTTLPVPSSPVVRLGFSYPGGSYIVMQSSSLGSPVGLSLSADFVSGVVDTGIADTVPPSGGIQVTMPYSGQPDVSGLLDSLNDALISGDTSTISAEILDDVGEPIVTDQTISVTPWSWLDSWLSSISGALSGIRSGISSLGETILEAVETGPIKLFQSVLDIIGSSFGAVFSRIRSGLGIWQYVVNWFGSISAPLSFLSSVLPSGVWVPIYASVAGSLVIAIFRRFGR